jgi:hypothetical protein
MRASLVTLLNAQSSITDLVSTRIYIDKAPEGCALPYIVILQHGSDEFMTSDNTGNLRGIDFSIICRAQRSITSESVADAVREFIQDYSGAAGSETISAVVFEGVSDQFEPPVDGSDIGKHASTLDLQILYNPA